MAKIEPNAGKKGAAAPTKKDKVKKEKVALPAFPEVGSEDPNVYPFKTVPTGFDHAKFEALDKKDFAKRSMYLEYRAQALEAKAKQLRELAKTADAKGGTGKASRFAKMMQKAADMRKELEAAGIDVDALLKQSAAQPTPQATATTTQA
jgi:hypothetical protein